MDRKSAVVAGVVLAGAILGRYFYYFQEALSALLLFALIFLPLLLLAFVLALAGRAGERAIAWLEARLRTLRPATRRLIHSRWHRAAHHRHPA
jgi:hypothetical protein